MEGLKKSTEMMEAGEHSRKEKGKKRNKGGIKL